MYLYTLIPRLLLKVSTELGPSGESSLMVNPSGLSSDVAAACVRPYPASKNAEENQVQVLGQVGSKL